MALAVPVEELDETVLNSCHGIMEKFFHHQQILSQHGVGRIQEARLWGGKVFMAF